MLDLVASPLALKAADFLNVIDVDEFPGGLAVDHLSCPPSAKPPLIMRASYAKRKPLPINGLGFLRKS